MKTLLILFCILSLSMFSQKPPEQGDYVARGYVAETRGNYIFKKSRMVYYDFTDSLSFKWEYAYKQEAKLVSSYFKKLDNANLSSMKSVDEKIIAADQIEFYSVLEYKKEGKLIRICWDIRGTDKNTETLNSLDASLNSFW